MKTVMSYLAKAESDQVHYVTGEPNITLPYGIAVDKHPSTKLGQYVEKVARVDLGIITDTADWNRFVLTRVNEALDEVVAYKLAVEFYEEYLRDAHLELFNEDCKITAMSLYVNSPKRYWKAVQRALLNLQTSGRLNNELTLSAIDGSYGIKTKNGLIEAASTVPGMTLEDNILLAMTLEYTELAAKNPDKYLKYLSGWLNRLNTLNKLK